MYCSYQNLKTSKWTDKSQTGKWMWSIKDACLTTVCYDKSVTYIPKMNGTQLMYCTYNKIYIDRMLWIIPVCFPAYVMNRQHTVLLQLQWMIEILLDHTVWAVWTEEYNRSFVQFWFPALNSDFNSCSLSSRLACFWAQSRKIQTENPANQRTLSCPLSMCLGQHGVLSLIYRATVQ